MSTITLELAESDARKVAEAVELCGFTNEAELAREALRRFLETHTAEFQEKYLMRDVEWGLHGED